MFLRVCALACMRSNVYMFICNERPKKDFSLSTPHSCSSLWGSTGIGKRCFESRNNSTNFNPFADRFLISREISKVSFGLPEGFPVTAKMQQQGMFRVTRNFSGYSENLAAGLPLRSRATCVIKKREYRFCPISSLLSVRKNVLSSFG